MVGRGAASRRERASERAHGQRALTRAPAGWMAAGLHLFGLHLFGLHLLACLFAGLFGLLACRLAHLLLLCCFVVA